jgi:Ca2+-transporting ATPase
MKKNNEYQGLTDEQVLTSRAQHGSNVLTPPARESLIKRFLRKFTDPLIIVLLIAGLLSIGISFYEYFGLNEGTEVFLEPLGIFVAILLSTGLAFIFEYKADREFDILNQVNDEEPVDAIRNGQVCRVPKSQVVVGDVILLNTGDEIPADGLLLEAVSLQVDESTLTGEPVCHKSINPVDFDSEATFPTNEVMRGTKVMEGHGVMEVKAVGDHTENGKVMVASQIEGGIKTPLNIQLDRLSALISKLSYLFAALVIIGRMADYFVNMGTSGPTIVEPQSLVHLMGYFLQTLMIAVTLIVVAVPEGLPMAVTLSLAYSMRRMLQTHNLVRKMHACETMGAATVICTDKTGTLTENRMRVSDFFRPEGVSFESLCYGMAVNSTAQLNGEEVIGNPTEGALLLWLKDKGVDYRKLRADVEVIEEVPFTTERKYMSSTVVMPDGTKATYIKGAPEIVLSMCEVDSNRMNQVRELLAGYQSKAMRTLAFACNDVFQGVVAISDPVRADVPDAVMECQRAGIQVKIVTGDTTGTAREIGRQVGLWTSSDDDHSVITGTDFEALSDAEALEQVEEIKIISRARPMDKKRFVELLQSRGEVVAVTGDGTNDAPALKAAHVGLSMGDGTSVAKEASDITIIDNSFSSIGRAVMWGRSLYRNIQRFILFQMTVNVVACLIVLVGAFFDTQSPLTVTQMLWVNLIMDTFAAMALASLPPSRSVMLDAPRDRRAFIIDGSMKWSIIFTGGIFTAILLFLYFYFEQDGLSRYELSEFFTIFVFLQFWNLFNAKAFMSGHTSFRKISHSYGFLSILAIIFIGQILIVTFGGTMFNVMPLKLNDWLMIIGGTSLVFLLPEIYRLITK